jgi:hypothetical protein
MAQAMDLDTKLHMSLDDLIKQQKQIVSKTGKAGNSAMTEGARRERLAGAQNPTGRRQERAQKLSQVCSWGSSWKILRDLWLPPRDNHHERADSALGQASLTWRGTSAKA